MFQSYIFLFLCARIFFFFYVLPLICNKNLHCRVWIATNKLYLCIRFFNLNAQIVYEFL